MIFFGKRKDDQDLLGDALRVMKGSIKIDFDYQKYSRFNIFNLLSKSSDYGFYYWPFGYLFRHFKWGTVNELGFREKYNFDQINEAYKNSYKIGFFGGSTGYDVLVPDEESLVYKLEAKLNKNKDLTDKYGHFKIINFSQPGNLVLNHIFNYIQFGSLVNLNMVISHSPANDFCTMQMNDPTLVRKYKIGYPDVLEAWGRKIHNAADIDIDYMHSEVSRPDFSPAKDRTAPVDLISAYKFRVRQFNGLALGNNQKFIIGFQPWITSKGEMSDKELIAFKGYNPYYQNIYLNVVSLYDSFDNAIDEAFKNIPVANIHRAFKSLKGDTTHFGDTHHLVGPGNEEAANCYYLKLMEVL